MICEYSFDVVMKELEEKYFSTCFKHMNEPSKEAYELNAKIYDGMYKHLLPKDKNCEILDVGCGMGHFLYYISKKGYKNFYGIDISKEQVDICKRYVTENIELIDTFIFLKERKEKYDLIVANDFIEHITLEQALEFVKLCFNALKENGQLIIKTPNMSAPFSNSVLYVDLTHRHGYTEHNLGQLLRFGSFEDVSFYPITYHPIRRMIGFFIKFLYKLFSLPPPSVVTHTIIGVGKKATK
ncbi:MAG: class I SAM-dependent methyltransferase [Candidatus Thermoplasmatota archaeon]